MKQVKLIELTEAQLTNLKDLVKKESKEKQGRDRLLKRTLERLNNPVDYALKYVLES